MASLEWTVGDIADLVDSIRRHYDDGCFACGRDNPIGLHLDHFEYADGEVSATFVPRPEYRGTEGSLHGGVAATALDEMLVWAAIISEGVMAVTGTMEIRYAKPVTTTDEITVTARVDERRGRRLHLSGGLSAGGEEKVRGRGLYLVTAEVGDLLEHERAN